jgi:hypothetical protein
VGLAGCTGEYTPVLSLNDTSKPRVDSIGYYTIDGWVNNDSGLRFDVVYVYCHWFDMYGKSVGTDKDILIDVPPHGSAYFAVFGRFHKDRYVSYRLAVEGQRW